MSTKKPPIKKNNINIKLVINIFFNNFFLLVSLFLISCTEHESFVDIKNQIVNPSAITSDGQYFFVLNSDIERKFNSGSIITISTAGQKLATVETARLGRFIVHASNNKKSYLFTGHSFTNQYAKNPMLNIYDASDPYNLSLVNSIELECTPAGIHVPSNYKYFALGCLNGMVYLGFWHDKADDDNEQSNNSDLISLKLIRDYGPHGRKALFIDQKNHILYAFASTNSSQPGFFDLYLEDKTTFDEQKNTTYNMPNEIPDEWENLDEFNAFEYHKLTSEFKFAVYDIKQGILDNFSYKSKLSEAVNTELRWLYFELDDDLSKEYKDDIAKTSSSHDNSNAKNFYRSYRSNFWQIIADKSQNSYESKISFLISQKGKDEFSLDQDANSIYRFSITDSPFKKLNNSKTSSGYIATSKFLSVKKVWGTNPELSLKSSDILGQPLTVKNKNIRYSGNFIKGNFDDKEYLIVNDFRDATTFDKHSFALTLIDFTKPLNIYNFSDIVHSFNRKYSFYGLSAIENILISGAFYSNTLNLFTISDDFKLTNLQTIK